MTTPYPHYKPSGVDWLGDIPTHWEVKKLKYLSKINGSRPSNDLKKILNEEVVFLAMEKVSEDGQISQDSRKKVRDGLAGFTYFERDDVILAKITPCFENGKSAFLHNLETEFGYGSTEFHTLKATKKIFPKFLYLLIKSERFMALGEAFMTGSAGQKRVPTSFVEQYSVSLPPLAEQTAIANYLDEKTEQIDTLIGEKRELINLLREERAGLINEAVTQGLHHRVPHKDSGLPWLGQIPAHWEVKKLKYVVKDIIDTAHKTVPFKENGDYFVVRTSDVRKGKLLIDNMRRTDQEGYLEWTERATPEEGDIFFTREAPAGEACVVPGNIPVCLGQRMVLFRTNKRKALSQFIVYQIYSAVVNEYVCLLSQGSTVSHFNMADIRNIPLVLPDPFEQAEIVVYLDLETARIDNTILTVEQEIELLTEYRSALISEVVTGKQNVS